MAVKGSRGYIPPSVTKEIEEIKMDLGIEKHCEALKVMANNSSKLRNMKKGAFKFTF